MRIGLRNIFITGFIATMSLAAVPSFGQTARIDPAPLPADNAVRSPEPSVQTPPTTPTPTSPSVPIASAPTALTPCITPSTVGNGDTTYHKDDLIGASEGVFGKGAKGLAQIIERTLKEQGEPNGYIAGREASGAFIVGVRYGSGTLCHKVEGQRPVYWTGPSLGFDVGGDATKVFVLVYNLYDSQDLYRRFGEVEGRAYFVGGLSVTYLRKERVVLIPVRLGVGLRLGANFGYMKITEKSRWFPF